MKVITAAELFHKTERELSALFTAATIVLAQTHSGTAERKNVLATLENVERARARVMARRLSAPGFG
jgi:hypothetical protein